MKRSEKFGRPASDVFHAVTHVWGREYLDLFLNLCIPNQLAPGNVSALPAGSRYRILTRSIHVDELQSHRMVRALRDVIPVDIVAIDELDRRSGVARGQDLMIACHQQSVAGALEMGAAIIFLSADFIFSADALAAVVRRHREGYRAVVNTGLRLNKESLLQHLAHSDVPLGGLSPRDLVRMALPHLHAHTASLMADARPFSQFPVGVCWRVGNDGLLARCLHLHPLMVDPMSRVLPRGSNDGRYLYRACPDVSRVHVVTDSDELQMFELTYARRTVVPASGHGASPWRVAAVASRCDSHQIEYWRRYRVRVHTADFDQRWDAAADASDAFAERVLRLRPYGRIARRWFWSLERMRQHGDRYRQAWRRRLPHMTLKQLLRPVRIAAHRSAKILRKSTPARVSARLLK